MTALTTPREHAAAARDFLSQWGIGPNALVTEEEGAPVRTWSASINDAFDSTAALHPRRAASMARWFDYVRNTWGMPANVETLQVRFGTRDFDDAVAGIWTPGARTFELHGDFIRFITGEGPADFSDRHFSGLRAVASSATVWVGWSESARTVIVYRVLEG